MCVPASERRLRDHRYGVIQLGAVSVPLQTSASVSQLRPIVAETEPRVFGSSIDDLGGAVELPLTATPARLVD